LASANRGDYPEAISQLHEAINDCGHCLSRPDLYKDLGLIECKSGNIADGHKDLLTAQSLKPEDPDIAKALELIGTAQLR
jgi:Tfp pilus assembly protein PilF